MRALFMETKTGEPTADLEVYDTQERQPRSFELYQEYSKCDMSETIRIRRAGYDEADAEVRRRLETEVAKEVDDFCGWLEATKNIQHTAAHYYSVSLKSLLLGLPIGVQVAQLFDIILSNGFTKHVFDSGIAERI
jgi:hypothetical protein